MQWIKVSDRLPEVGISVLVTDGESNWHEISWRYIYNEKKPDLIWWYTSCCCNEFSDKKIKYWMPLPAQPTGIES